MRPIWVSFGVVVALAAATTTTTTITTTPIEYSLELIIEHVHDPDCLARLAQLNRYHHDLARPRLRPAFVAYVRHLFNAEFHNEDKLAHDLDQAVTLCGHRPDVIDDLVDNDARIVAIIRRAQSVYWVHPNVTSRVMQLVASREAVRPFVWGFMTFWKSPPGLIHQLTECAPPQPGLLDVTELPDALVQYVREHVVGTGRSHPYSDWYPAPFGLLAPDETFELHCPIAERFLGRASTRPAICRTLLKFGIQICLDDLPWTGYTAPELHDLLPFVVKATAAFKVRVLELIAAGRTDLISTLLHCDQVALFLNSIVADLFDTFIRRGLHSLLRELLRVAGPAERIH
jgi:hypothetical protein